MPGIQTVAAFLIGFALACAACIAMSRRLLLSRGIRAKTDVEDVPTGQSAEQTHLDATHSPGKSPQGVAPSGATQETTAALMTPLGHDLRSQLNSLLGMAELLLDTDVTALQREYLEDLMARAEMLATGVNDFLDLGHWQAGKLRLERLSFQLRDTLSNAVGAAAATARRKHIHVEHTVRTEVPDLLVGDPGRLRQIVLALLDAVMHEATAGRAHLEVSRECETEERVELHFVLRYSGAIDADRLIRMFEADVVDVKDTQLAALLCRYWIDLMGGRLGVSRSDGSERGSIIFQFTASFDLPNRPLTSEHAFDSTRLGSLPVLVVCDREARKREIVRMLRNSGMTAQTTFNARSAMDALETSGFKEDFGLVIVDWLPPGEDPFELASRIKLHLQKARVILLVSVGLRGDITRCREAGISAYVTRPISQSDLMDTVLAVMAAPPEDETVVTRHMLRQSKRRLRILLAEDNTVAQTVGIHLLEERGHSVVLARNGREALQAFRRGVFDVILTDVQMPEMNGFELTRAIRAMEETTGKHIPIVAVTAHELTIGREQCQNAGMDGYIAKPLTSHELFREIDMVLESTSDVSAGTEEKFLDPRLAFENCAGNMKVLKDRTNQMLDGIDGEVRRMQAAIKAREWNAVSSTARGLSARWEELGALPLATQLSNFGQMALTEPLEAIEETFGRLVGTIENAKAHLADLEHAGPRRILIADDDSVSRILLEDLLVGWGYEVVLAQDGQEAWRILQADDPPRLAILDWMMPKMDGVQVCREVRRWREEPYIYLILLTMRADKEDIISGLDAGADDYLVKSFDASELKMRLRAGLRIIELQEELISARETLRHQATHDALTGVLNRRALLETLQLELARSERSGGDMGLIMLDLDHFKRINDSFGHQAGDAVLRETARRMKELFRPYEIVGRYGGEEFVVALPRCDMRNAEAHAERLRRSLAAEPVLTLEGPIAITASLGVCSTSPTGVRDCMQLLHACDMALYRAKSDGRNCARSAVTADYMREIPLS